MRRRRDLFIFLLLLSGGGCASWQGREGVWPEIQISDTSTGGSLELSPPLLTIEPGERVVWINHTTYEIQIEFEPGEKIQERPFFISPFSRAVGRFDREGTYSYTLTFSSSRTFGRVKGSIIVQNKPSEKGTPEAPPTEETPDTDAYII